MKPTDEVHWITSRQLSPSPATKRNHSPASLSLQSSFSKDSSFLASSVVACLLNLSSGSLSLALAARKSEKSERNGENCFSEIVASWFGGWCKVAKPEEFLWQMWVGSMSPWLALPVTKTQIYLADISLYIYISGMALYSREATPIYKSMAWHAVGLVAGVLECWPKKTRLAL